jgi:hypothetical protein
MIGIYYREKKVGEFRDHKIFSDDEQLNNLLAILDKKQGKGLIAYPDGNTHKLKFSGNPEDFYTYLMYSGYDFVDEKDNNSQE